MIQDNHEKLSIWKSWLIKKLLNSDSSKEEILNLITNEETSDEQLINLDDNNEKSLIKNILELQNKSVEDWQNLLRKHRRRHRSSRQHSREPRQPLPKLPDPRRTRNLRNGERVVRQIEGRFTGHILSHQTFERVPDPAIEKQQR